jgi:hypothetical protein
MAIRLVRQFHAQSILQATAEFFEKHGPPACIRSSTGPQFVAAALRE